MFYLPPYAHLIASRLCSLVFHIANPTFSQKVNPNNHQFLRNPGKYKSVSAFAPITNPTNCPWGQKAFKGYFGDDQQDKWKEHDATELIKKWNGGPLDILIDVVSFLHTCFPYR